MSTWGNFKASSNVECARGAFAIGAVIDDAALCRSAVEATWLKPAKFLYHTHQWNSKTIMNPAVVGVTPDDLPLELWPNMQAKYIWALARTWKKCDCNTKDDAIKLASRFSEYLKEAEKPRSCNVRAATKPRREGATLPRLK